MEQTDKPELLTLDEMMECYPDEWLLLVDLELDESTEIKTGRVILHSKRRGDIYRAQRDCGGHMGILFAGEIPRDLEVLL